MFEAGWRKQLFPLIRDKKLILLRLGLDTPWPNLSPCPRVRAACGTMGPAVGLPKKRQRSKDVSSSSSRMPAQRERPVIEGSSYRAYSWKELPSRPIIASKHLDWYPHPPGVQFENCSLNHGANKIRAPGSSAVWTPSCGRPPPRV